MKRGLKQRLKRMMATLTASAMLSCTVMGNITTADTTELLQRTSSSGETGPGVMLNAAEPGNTATGSDAVRPASAASGKAAPKTPATGSNAEYQVDEDGHILDGMVFDDVTEKFFVPTVSYVDEFGEPLKGRYTDVELPGFGETLVLDDPENAPVDDVEVRSGFLNMHRTTYSYLYATADGERIREIRKTTSTEEVELEIPEDSTRSNASRATADDAERILEVEKEVYAYTADGEEWTDITEDTELLFVFAQEGLTSYVYEDDDITVTAQLQYEDAIPAGVELKVTPITEKSTGYNYDAYMQALNDNAADLAAAEDSAKNYSRDNTLLYDIAFIKTGFGGKEVEYEPEKGSVKITADFHKNQLSGTLGAASADKIDVIHLPLTEEVKETIDATKDAVDISAADIKTEKIEDAAVQLPEGSRAAGDSEKESVEFIAESFSAFAFTYTVDFTYGNYTYSFPGQGSYALTSVLAALNLTGDVKDASLKLVKGKDHEDALYLSRKDDGWYINSDRAFTDTYELTVNTRGANYVITVTDAQNFFEVTVNFYDYDAAVSKDSAGNIEKDANGIRIINGTQISFEQDEGDTATYNVLASVKDNEGAVKYYAVNQLEFDEAGYAKTTTFSKFVDVNSYPWEIWNMSKVISYSAIPDSYTISTRLIAGNGNSYTELANANDTVSGYEFLGNDSNRSQGINVIALKRAYPKYYHLRFEMDPAGLSVDAEDAYYVLIEADHSTTDKAYAWAPLEISASDEVRDIKIDTWYKASGEVRQYEKFTGEEPVTVGIYTTGDKQKFSTFSGFFANQQKFRIAEGESFNLYDVTYEKERETEEDEETHAINIYEVIGFTASPGTIEKSDIDDAISQARKYAIYTENLSGHSGDMEVTFAADTVTGVMGAYYGLTGNNLENNRISVTKIYLDNGQPVEGETVSLTLYKVTLDDDGKVTSRENKGSYEGTTDSEGKLTYTFSGLVPGYYEIAETINGETVYGENGTAEIGEGDNKITVTFSDRLLPIVNENLNVHYIGKLEGENYDDYTEDINNFKWLISRGVHNSAIPLVLVVADETDYRNLLRANAELNPGEQASAIYPAGENPEYPELDIPADMESLRELSAALGNSESSSTVHVINTTYENHNDVVNNLRDDGRYIVVNIDMTGVDASQAATILSKPTRIDGVTQQADFDKSGSSYAEKILYNLITYDSEGNAVPYTGEVITGEQQAGTLLIPFGKAGQVKGLFGGTIIAREVDHSGNEIHAAYEGNEVRKETGLSNSTGSTGVLELSKILVSDAAADANQEFTFTVTLSDTTIGGTYGGMTFTNGKAEVKLKGGESAKAEGLPTGITYTVTEAEAAGFELTGKNRGYRNNQHYEVYSRVYEHP